MSWGSSESAGDIGLKLIYSDANRPFRLPSDFFAQHAISLSGQLSGLVSPNVVAVGGTFLSVSGNSYSSETGWSGSGGGISTIENKTHLSIYGHAERHKRTIPDVSFNANKWRCRVRCLRPRCGRAVAFGVWWHQLFLTSVGRPDRYRQSGPHAE